MEQKHTQELKVELSEVFVHDNYIQLFVRRGKQLNSSSVE